MKRQGRGQPQRSRQPARRTGPQPRDALAIRVRRLPHGADLPLPAYQSDHAAGLDLLAAVPAGAPMLIMPGHRMLVPTGLAIEIPVGHEGQVRPRSGLAVRHGVTVLNSPGTIDSDYRGEIQVLLVNHGFASFPVHRGQRIAQLVVAPVMRAALRETASLAPTRRGEGGFGSTGTASQADARKRKSIPRKRRK